LLDRLPPLEVALAIPQRAGRVLVARRAEQVPMAGYWEFPGGKLLPGEAPADAARRELREETGLEAEGVEPLAGFVHDYPERAIRFHVFLAREPRGAVRTERPTEWAWKRPCELAALAMPPANARIIETLLAVVA
jgi:mutator protein MutT